MTTKQKQLVETYIRKEVRKRLNEKSYEEPAIPQDRSDPNFESALRQYINWTKQFYSIANLLTNSTGYWYIGSGKSEIADKIKKLSPDQLKDFRTQIAKLLLKSREADKIMKEVKITAQEMIEALD